MPSRRAAETGLTEAEIRCGRTVLRAYRQAPMVRCDPADTDALLTEPHAAPMEMRGRAMAGWLLVEDECVAGEADLARWVEVGLRRARALPAK